ncbi:HsdM family class I SAM-dependent methyltransferase [Dyadobacter arcticus]|uniref:site-specific DNA-methyltransferase (adenine-specific) n=1 Tax=Dyadobacter arcticus TaxID=1078754 RepID=A0ABX0UQV6_9BACT|nr:N-6 DNA methylase [Dyadobacter arcticus]NIJ55212.1 type I restriction enzyme M protein [Dyadobacter arcticus]
MANENLSKYKLPDICDWQSLIQNNGGNLLDQYENILKTLSNSGGMLSKIFANSSNKIHDSSKLKKLIGLINEQNWTLTGTDIKGEIYESLLQKNAESSGAGQYFTPRAIIQAMVNCLQPKALETIADPSCGTGGFFLGVLDYLEKQSLSKREVEFLKFNTFHGWEIEKSTARLCLMNLYLHGIGDLDKTPDIHVTDSLKVDFKEKVKIVLANPPFGKSSSDIPTIDERQAHKEGFFLRRDFWVTTSNKQLAFLQHIVTMLQEDGRAAVVLPDNVLFEGGAGETVRRRLLAELNLHTILRLPTGIFYAQGVKANVLFFDKQGDSVEPATKHVWVYDYRTNIRHTPKKNILTYDSLGDFVSSYKPGDRESRNESWSKSNLDGRWKKFSYDEIIARDKVNLDLFWIKDDNIIDLDNLPDPEDLISEIIENLEIALSNFKSIKESISYDG